MKITPVTEEEATRGPLLPEGEYEVVVLDAEETVSKKGNEMMKLTLEVYHDGGTRRVWDYLLDSFAHKLRHFCDHAGIIDKYESGTLTAEDCKGRRLRAEIEIKAGTGGYADNNAVVDYLPKKPGANDAPAPVTIDEDDIPF